MYRHRGGERASPPVGGGGGTGGVGRVLEQRPYIRETMHSKLNL